jgi:hypothetical protein
MNHDQTGRSQGTQSGGEGTPAPAPRAPRRKEPVGAGPVRYVCTDNRPAIDLHAGRGKHTITLHVKPKRRVFTLTARAATEFAECLRGLEVAGTIAPAKP